MTAATASPLPEALERDLLSILGLDSLEAAPASRRAAARDRGRPAAAERARLAVRVPFPSRALLSSRAASASIGVAALVALVGGGAALVTRHAPDLFDGPKLGVPIPAPASLKRPTAPPVLARTTPPIALAPAPVAPVAEAPQDARPAVPAERRPSAPRTTRERAVRPARAERVELAARTTLAAPARPVVAPPAPAPRSRTLRPEPAPVALVNNRAQPETLVLGPRAQPEPAPDGYANNRPQPETLLAGRLSSRPAATSIRPRAEPTRRERRDSVDALMTLRRQW